MQMATGNSVLNRRETRLSVKGMTLRIIKEKLKRIKGKKKYKRELKVDGRGIKESFRVVCREAS